MTLFFYQNQKKKTEAFFDYFEIILRIDKKRIIEAMDMWTRGKEIKSSSVIY